MAKLGTVKRTFRRVLRRLIVSGFEVNHYAVAVCDQVDAFVEVRYDEQRVPLDVIDVE